MPHPDDTHPSPTQPRHTGGSARAARTADRAVQIDPRLLAELQARVAALEAWRAHQSDLLDELLNPTDPAPPGPPPANRGRPTTRPTRHGGTRGLGTGPIPPSRRRSAATRSSTGCTTRRRRDRPPAARRVRWCPLWWDHPEAVFRFEALRRRLDRTRRRTRRRHVDLDPRPPRPLPARAAQPRRPLRRLQPTANASASSPPTAHYRPCPPSPPSGRRPHGRHRCPSPTKVTAAMGTLARAAGRRRTRGRAGR